MIQITPHMRIMLAVDPVDFRKGIDGLAGLCRRVLHADPFGGTVFIFRNRKGTSIKILIYDGEAFWLLTRRLSRGKISWWPSSLSEKGTISHKEFQTLIMNGNPDTASFSDDWKKLI